MTLLAALLDLLEDWRTAFPQLRSWRLAARHALGSLVCLGRRSLSRILWTNGDEQQSWSKHYFLYARSPWAPQALFGPILKRALAYCPGRWVGVAVDDTRLRKTGRTIPQAFYQRDPLSPPFHWNLMLGLRFLQASLLLPLYRNTAVGPRGLPIRFQEVSVVKRPRKKAPPEEWQRYRQQVKQHNLSRRFVEMMGPLRRALDAAGGQDKRLVIAGDGSFCNRTVFTAPTPGVQIIARARKDAKLCLRAPSGSRRFYAADKFTPEQVRQDEQLAWKTTKLFYGGKRRKIRYKLLQVYWQGGARRRPRRLIVVAPTPYRKRKSGRRYYRQPAYWLTTELSSPVKPLLQIYLDRWPIAVNHREEKDTLGVGQAQLWNPIAVPKQPPLAVAAYSALLLAALVAFGPERGPMYARLPKWRRHAKRPSCLDLVTLLRTEIVQHPQLLAKLDLNPSQERLVRAAAA